MHFKKHLFFCTNQKDNGNKCCAAAGAADRWAYAKHKVAAEGLATNNQVRVNKSACLGRCAEGPCMVIYPEGVWYTYQNEDDIDEIIDKAVKQDVKVPRLLMDTI